LTSAQLNIIEKHWPIYILDKIRQLNILDKNDDYNELELETNVFFENQQE
jgi:hypothetical protein